MQSPLKLSLFGKGETQFEWGGQTPTAPAKQLAYTLLRAAGIAAARSKACYQAFTEEVICQLHPTWTIVLSDIKSWVRTWEEEQAYIKQLEASRPKAIAPRSLPYYGVMEPILLSCAYKTLRELVLAANFEDAHSAMLHLELAHNLAEARRKTVNSIFWNKARAEARSNIWYQLLLLEVQIAHNLRQFGDWWNLLDKNAIAQALASKPLPDYVTRAEDEYQERLADMAWSSVNLELNISLFNIQQIVEQMEERIERYQPFLHKRNAQLDAEGE